MSGITGMGTTFNLPNFHGELYGLTPAETPLLSAIGGLTGGGSTDSTNFEWQTYDLRDAASRPRLEGADAPTAEERVRGNAYNTLQIFQEAVTTSYTKVATSGQYTTPGSAPFIQNAGSPNPVGNEHDWQIAQALKQIARDVEYTFWHSNRVVPTDNNTARQTQGLLGAITTNAFVAGALAGAGGTADATKTTSASAATDTITVTHNLAVGDKVVFTNVGVSALKLHKYYWVVNVTGTTAFKISATKGGAAITIGTATLDFFAAKATSLVTPDIINTVAQALFDNGGITEEETRTLYVSSSQQRAISKAYAIAYGSTEGIMGETRNVGGVKMQTILTDFGTFNLKVDRFVPDDAIAILSLEQLTPVFLSIPGKGVLFEEELAKTGASNKSQIYGEIGLKYGNQVNHGVIRGLFA